MNRRWLIRAALGAGAALALSAACDSSGTDDGQCNLRWECGVDIYTVDCEPSTEGQDHCVCERNESRTGTCDRGGICVDAAAYHEEDADRAQLELNLKSNTVSCCGYSVSTENSRCTLRVE